MKNMPGFAAAIAIGLSWGGAYAQTTVYDCGGSTYSEKPCSGRIVTTDEAPVELKPKAHRSQVIAHRLPGETAEELALRQRRIHLSESDRDECARLDTKIPFEQQRMKGSVRAEEIENAKEAIAAAKKRFQRLRC
jgi:hypothetical protein